jgi:hypothetical protein
VHVATRILLAIDDSDYSRAATESIAIHIGADTGVVHVIHVIELDRLGPPPIDAHVIAGACRVHGPQSCDNIFKAASPAD